MKWAQLCLLHFGLCLIDLKKKRKSLILSGEDGNRHIARNKG